MAWLLAQESLDFEGEALPRGKVLLMGGDQVYPTAEAVAYEDRFIGPVRGRAARRAPRPTSPRCTRCRATTTGTTAWAASCACSARATARSASWRTRQRRSYFALKMPNDWWVWAIDIQLDTYIDDPQLEYFMAQPVKPGDKVLLMTAKPAWIKALPGRVEPASWRYLSYFEERVVRASGARLVATLTGDIHHYARYEARDDAGRAAAPDRRRRRRLPVGARTRCIPSCACARWTTTSPRASPTRASRSIRATPTRAG